MRKGRRYKLWWSGKGDRVVGVWDVVMEELSEMVVEAGKVKDML